MRKGLRATGVAQTQKDETENGRPLHPLRSPIGHRPFWPVAVDPFRRDLDVLWREFIHLGRTDTAHKTQYDPLAVMRIFWAEALHPDIAHLYHLIRTLPMSSRPGRNVGHDMPCEWLHKALTNGVQAQVSQERIHNFILDFPFFDQGYGS